MDSRITCRFIEEVSKRVEIANDFEDPSHSFWQKGIVEESTSKKVLYKLSFELIHAANGT